MFNPPWLDAPNRPIVLAFGGNALLPGGGDDAGVEARAAEFSLGLIRLLPDHAGMVLVHGNGPQVGNLLLRVEATVNEIPPEPLDVLVAETQGSIGYLLCRSIRTALRRRGREVEVAMLATQVVVDRDDPAFTNPTKPIGPFYDPSRKDELLAKGWDLVDVPNRGLRRLVPSPHPKEIVEIHTIKDATRHGHLVVAGGGGGIPVARTEDGGLVGLEAVIDKDWTAALIARSIRAAGFVILTEVPHAYTEFGSPQQARIASMTATEARRLLADGVFPKGSMGPKIEAAADYAEDLERPGLITSVSALREALAGTAGTWITPG